MSFSRLALPCLVSVCLVAVLAPASAAADSSRWSRATLASAATYFPAGSSAMIAGVGPGAQPVAAALLGSLQSSETLELVIDARALGDISDLADDAIVKRAFARPIQRLAIVRVFPSAGSVKAVVTVYAAHGQVTTAFTLAPGRTLADNPSPEAAEDGVRRDEMLSVHAGAEAGAPGEDVITYDRQHITGVTGYGVVTLENVNFFKNGRLISDTPALYEALGMKSEASAYRSQAASHRSSVRRGSIMSGLGLTGVLAFGTWALVAGGTDYDYVTGTTTESSRTIPLLLTAGSTVMMIAGIYMMAGTRPANLTVDEAVALVDAHNQKKRRTTDARTGPRDMHLVPSAMPSGAGLVFGGSF